MARDYAIYHPVYLEVCIDNESWFYMLVDEDDGPKRFVKDPWALLKEMAIPPASVKSISVEIVERPYQIREEDR